MYWNKNVLVVFALNEANIWSFLTCNLHYFFKNLKASFFWTSRSLNLPPRNKFSCNIRTDSRINNGARDDRLKEVNCFTIPICCLAMFVFHHAALCLAMFVFYHAGLILLYPWNLIALLSHFPRLWTLDDPILKVCGFSAMDVSYKVHQHIPDNTEKITD